MRIKHLKNQLKCFTLQSGRSLYLYPYAEIEIAEQDFFLSSKLQAYSKGEKAIMVVQYEPSEAQEEISPAFVDEARKTRKQKKSLAKETKE